MIIATRFMCHLKAILALQNLVGRKNDASSEFDGASFFYSSEFGGEFSKKTSESSGKFHQSLTDGIFAS